MKKILLISSLIAVHASMALGAVTARQVSLHDFAGDLSQFQIDGGTNSSNGGTCSFATQVVQGALVIEATSDNGAKVGVRVTNSSKILLLKDSASTDFSSRKYRIDDKYTVKVQSADDAFIIAGISNGSTSIICEQDF
jgi:hypothetical protein